jgi:predicted phosphoadenosine phosphosulfate sulfurtransferase
MQTLSQAKQPTATAKRGLGIDVLTAARQRIAWTFDTFPRIYVSYSGGKDSTVMLHLVMEEAIRRGRKVGVLFVDLEAQYQLTIDHVRECFRFYAEHIEPYWVSLPIHLRNAVSQFEPHWICWEPGLEADWVRQPEPILSITDPAAFPFFRHAMEFEEFVPAFGHWYGGGKLTACLVGIRADESLNRYRTVKGGGWKSTFEGRQYTTWCSRFLYNVYPIYDWRTEDIWRYHGKYPSLPYNRLYDRMHQAGLTLSQMRICQPYGDDQRRGLWLFHLIEPETWARVVARVNGANGGALYVQESGNISGYRTISKPDGHTWQSFARLLLASQPPKTREHFENKIAVFLHWWEARGYPSHTGGIPDEADPADEAAKKVPSWRRICKALLRNDYHCKGMSFTQTKSDAYERYRKIMKKRRNTWGVF